jgi:uncharacterized membrane protein SpoIIM required for sporulation
MAEITLKSRQFRLEREGDWRRLEQLLDRAEKGSAASLSYDEMVALPALYRGALSSLSVARAISLDQAVIDYLEGLAIRGYFFVYGPRSTLLERLGGFFARAWPNAVKAIWRETLIAAAITIVAAVAAYLLVRQDPDWFNSFIPQGLASGRDPSASTEALRKTLYDSGGAHAGLSVLATYLFTHNAQVALFAFALGFAFCIPTAFLMAYNGCMVGAFFALFGQHGLAFGLGGWLFIHGATELFAVTLAGAAGFRIGWTLVFPGERTRMDALSEAGRLAATVMGGVVIMLIVAGMLEGFARQLITNDFARYGVALTTAVVWGAYFYAPRRTEPARG